MKYIVINENTLGYRIEGSPFIGVLAGSVLRGGSNPINGTISLSSLDLVRDATLSDFEFFRVCASGHLV